MRPAVLILDDFYPDPDRVREHALRQTFVKCDHCPGDKTSPAHTADAEFYNSFAPLLISPLGLALDQCEIWSQFVEIPCYDPDPNSALNQPWVHQDRHTWSFVIYLTPGFNMDSGTRFFRHKNSAGFDLQKSYDTKKRFFGDQDSTDYQRNWHDHESHFEEILNVPNVYNRCVIFPGNVWHRGGSSHVSSGATRLTQTGGLHVHAQKP